MSSFQVTTSFSSTLVYNTCAHYSKTEIKEIRLNTYHLNKEIWLFRMENEMKDIKPLL